MPTPSRITLSVLACAVVLGGAVLTHSDASYGARQATCLLVSPVTDLPALATPPLPDHAPTILVFPEPPLPESGATITVLWEDVYGEQHIAVDPSDELRRKLDRDQRHQQARACDS